MDGWNIVWRVSQRDELEIFFWKKESPQIENLESMNLFFLPLNATSQTQPMDQGVIRSLKTQYHKNVVSTIIPCVTRKNLS